MAPTDSSPEEPTAGETPRPNGVSTRETPPGTATPTPDRGKQLRDVGYYLGLVLAAVGCWELLVDGHPVVGAGSLAAGVVLFSIPALIDRRRAAESLLEAGLKSTDTRSLRTAVSRPLSVAHRHR